MIKREFFNHDKSVESATKHQTAGTQRRPIDATEAS